MKSRVASIFSGLLNRTRTKLIGSVFIIVCTTTSAQLHFSENVSIDVTKAGVSVNDPLTNIELKYSDSRILRFNVLWTATKPEIVNGNPSTGGFYKEITAGISAGVSLEKKVVESLQYEVSVVSLTDEIAVIKIE